MKSISLKAIAFLATVGALFAARADYTVTDSATVAGLGGATGGDEIRMITAGGLVDVIHIFTSTSAVGKLVMPSDTSKFVSGSGRLLVVGGGGAGGNTDGSARSGGGGGGAGGLVYREGLDFMAGATYTATVGAGGATGGNNGSNGSKSTLALTGETITANGGGGGGRRGSVGSSGGSAGGSGSGSYTQTATQPTSTSGGYGNVGGHAGTTDSTYYGGGGGGGAGGEGTSGEDGSRPGNGGDGLAYDISGETVYYAAGGGGGAQSTMTAEKIAACGLGGSGVGGRGGHPGLLLAEAGKDGTGSGGGGVGGAASSTKSNGAGGSGVVIVRYTLVTKVDTIDSDQAVELGGASGGDEVRMIDNGDRTYDIIHIFTDTSAAATLEIPGDCKIVAGSYRVLAVGGGGSGGSDCGGGGGAGGLVYETGLSFAAGSTIDITVGAGGAAVSGKGFGKNGGDTTLAINGTELYHALGGGGGGYWVYSGTGRDGLAGGCGGGATYSNGTRGTGGDSIQASTYGYGVGFAGVGHTYGNVGGGGGGAGGAGQMTGAGGAGLAYDISGFSMFYAGGGGGGGDRSDVTLDGGSGVGGNGRDNDSGAVTAGLDGTGSGGGGSGKSAINDTSGAGGSGTVIIRYTVDRMTRIPTDAGEISVYGAVTNWVDGELVMKFTDVAEAGELNLPGAVNAWVLAVGGGGAGANPGPAAGTKGGAGGGGAGGYVENTALSLASGSYTVQVGAGGVSPSTQGEGGDGDPSYVQLAGADTLRAAGGGGGGMLSAGRPGGSGGGASNTGTAGTTILGGVATPAGQGNDGGKSYHQGTSTGQVNTRRSGAGGGGAGGAGADAVANNQGAAGGAGKENAITGESVVYAAGGGGGSMTGTGGAGGSDGVGGTGGGGSTASPTAATAGRNGTGSGGGGGNYGKDAENPGGKGGSGVIIIRIRKVMPVKPPEAAAYSYGIIETIYANPNANAVTIKDEGGNVVDKITSDLAVGMHTFTSTLKDGWTWSDGTTAAVTTTVTISKPTLVVETLTLAGWQEGDTPNAPVLVVVNQQGDVVTLPEANATFKVSSDGGASWSRTVTLTEWPTFAAALTANDYTLTVEITGTENFDAPTFIPQRSFKVWAGLVNPVVTGLGYSADLTLAAAPTVSTTVRLTISEDLVPGFRYDQVEDPSEIRFAANGAVLPSALLTWDAAGDSTFLVTIPAGVDTLSLNWGRLVDDTGADVPVAEMAASAFACDFTRETTETALPTGWTEYQYNGNNTPRFNLTANGATVAQPWKKNALDTAFSFTGTSQTFKIVTYETAADCNAVVYLSSPTYSVCIGHSYTSNQEISIGAFAGDASTQFVTFQTGTGTNPENCVEVAAAGEITLGQSLTYVLTVNGTALTGTVSDGTVTKSIAYTLPVGTSFARIGLMLDGAVGTVGVQSISGVGTATAWGAEATFTCDHTTTVQDARFKNWWLVTPDCPTTWGTGEEPQSVLTTGKGTPLYGASLFTITAIGTTETLTNKFPTAAGSYKVVFVVPAGNDLLKRWMGLTWPAIEVQVTAHSPRTDLSGTEGSATRSGRVLLANNDTNGSGPITDQDYTYTETNATRSVYWQHGGDTPPSDLPNLKEGSAHELMAATPVAELCGATNIWSLSDIYLGTTYNAALNVILQAVRNLLPYSSTSATTLDGAMHLVMRNKIDAQVVSPCYTNGVGTIYFDAVNAWTTAAGEGYGLVVEKLTGAAAKTGIATEAEPWTALEMHPLLRDTAVGSAFVAQTATTALDLAVTNGQYATENFYRIYVPVETHEPIRFRIRRTSVPLATDGSGNPRFDEDKGGFILLDNIVVSYPAMRADLSSLGLYDATKAGKEALGYENAWSVPFPALGDTVNPRAQVTYYTNPGDTNANVAAFVTAANLHYRWRYLAQQANDWATVALGNLANPIVTAPDALNLKNAAGEVLPGDVEFWYDLTLNAPYYKYVDYAAVSGFKMSDFYSEEVTSVTNRRDAAEGVLSTTCGTDWFVRLREGKSEYEELKVVYYRSDEDVASPGGDVASPTTNTVVMEIVSDHTWRGYLATPTNFTGTVQYRIEACNLQTAGATEFATNTVYWHNGTGTSALPVSTTLAVGDETSWSGLPIDAATGYLLFQVDDRTRSITILHADYQNFQAWSDAAGKLFKSTSTDDSGHVGTSAKKVTYEQTFNDWQTMPATNADHWSESFIPSTGVSGLGYDLYTTYASITTPNGWLAGQGMYIYGNYKDDQDDATGHPNLALQMEGQGRGYIQFADSANRPRGIESISYAARVAQFIDFTDFSYYDAPSKGTMTNYTLAARVAYDTNSNKDFSGNASLSLVAYYRPGIGCYEFRIEQLKASRNTTTKAVTGINRKSERLSFYKWVYDQATGQMNRQCLGYTDYTAVNIPNTSSMTGSFWPVFFSVSNDVAGASTFLTAGVMRSDTGLSYSSSFANNDGTYFVVGFRDTATTHLTGGTYGCVSANCPGVFQTPFTTKKPLGFLGGTLKNDQMMQWSQQSIALGTYSTCLSTLSGGDWSVTPGRMQAYWTTNTDGSVPDDYKWGLKARTPTAQKLVVYTSTDETNWKSTGVTNIVSTFGTSTSSGTKYTVPVYAKENCSVRVAPVGTVSDVRVDVVIDDIEIRQFRGDDSYNLSSAYIPEAERESNVGYSSQSGHTNFLFTSAWISNTAGDGKILLSAKRTLADHVSSIRAPLMDGVYDRGRGLGMFTFDYLDAQANAQLLVQVATNQYVGTSTIANETPLWDTPDYWTTVTNINFAAMSATERKKGTISVYFGLHNKDGVARLVVPTNLIAQVANVTDTSAFGEVWISRVAFRDEPSLDSRSWTGWNLRTVGDATDSEKFMYLPDFDFGQSLALNNSITADVGADDLAEAKEQRPFVQTPNFETDQGVGSVTFRARKYQTADSQPAAVVLLGSKTGDLTGSWTALGEPFIVSNDTYTTYTYTTDPGESWKAFRLSVSGVTGVENNKGTVKPAESGYTAPVRVLLDEIFVSEAVRPRVGFFNVGAFRGYWKAGNDQALENLKAVNNVPSEDEQPLCNESWGVQCEIRAVQLPDEIDFSITPRVRLSWYTGPSPWGYENWKNSAAAKSAWLARATDTDDDTYVFRSSYLGGNDNVITPATAPGTIVQYMLEVIYHQVGSSGLVTNTLTESDWTVPAWYKPVDYNNTIGKGETFAAYNILDTVAPHWAWINEVNIFGGYDSNWINKDRNFQYVEVAVPAEADISGWYVNLLAPHEDTGLVITNRLGTFGQLGLSGTKANNANMEDNMVFRVLASQSSKDAGNVKTSDGSLDGVWQVQTATTEITASGDINAIYPVGFQLVRASGIVEHEVLALGTNMWDDASISESYRLSHNPTNNVNFLNEHAAASFFYAGQDDGGDTDSLGVYTARGETSNYWNNVMIRTPGKKNAGQTIDADHPTPNGSSIIVYCNLDTATGRIRQTVGDAVLTNASQFVFIKKGSDTGTNITYQVDPWYVLGTVTTNGQPAAATPLAAARTYVLENVGKGASNNVTVVASARLNDRLLGLLGENNRYTPAVVKWLEGGTTRRGEVSFKNPSGDAIYLAPYMGLSGNVHTNLTLTEMYWLDMDPTYPLDAATTDASALALIGGVATAPVEKYVTLTDPKTGAESIQTNIRMRVKMAITNRVEGKVWAPYVINSVVPGENSIDNYVPGSGDNWTGATFKITALVNNGKTSMTDAESWIPLRWFVFTRASFQNETGSQPFTSDIDVVSPKDSASPGYWEGIRNWLDKDVFYFWAIDDRLKPYTVEDLEQTNYNTK